MDISSIVAAERVVDIKHPKTNEPIGLRVTLRPDSDPVVVAARRKWMNERLQKGSKVTAEKLEAQATEVIAAAVAGWEWLGDLTFEGSKPDFSQETLRKVLKKLPWVKAQLDEELGDAAAFFPS